MAENLDIDQPIVLIDPGTKEFKATPYFEDLLFGIVESIGGEGESEPTDSFDLVNMHQTLLSLPAKISALRSDFEASAQENKAIPINSKLNKQKRAIADIEQLLTSVVAENAYLKSVVSKLSPVKVVNIATGATTHTTAGNELIMCNNTAALTITLNTTPKDNEKITVIRRDGTVSMVGTLNGSTPTSVPSKNDIIDVYYATSAGEWSA